MEIKQASFMCHSKYWFMGHQFIDLYIRNRDVYGAKGNGKFMIYVAVTLFSLRAVALKNMHCKCRLHLFLEN